VTLPSGTSPAPEGRSLQGLLPTDELPKLPTPHAARIVAQAWTRILWRCWHDHLPYNPELHGQLRPLTNQADPRATWRLT